MAMHRFVVKQWLFILVLASSTCVAVNSLTLEQRVEKLEKNYVSKRLAYSYYSMSLINYTYVTIILLQDFNEKKFGSQSETFRSQRNAIADKSWRTGIASIRHEERRTNWCSIGRPTASSSRHPPNMSRGARGESVTRIQNVLDRPGRPRCWRRSDQRRLRYGVR